VLNERYLNKRAFNKKGAECIFVDVLTKCGTRKMSRIISVIMITLLCEGNLADGAKMTPFSVG
jgi:hypothetical protein